MKHDDDIIESFISNQITKAATTMAAPTDYKINKNVNMPRILCELAMLFSSFRFVI